MADFLSGLGGLVKGLSGFMPQDDPNVQLLNAQTEVNDLQKQLSELYAEVGREAEQRYGLEAFGDLAGRIRLVQANLQMAQGKLQSFQQEKEAREKAEAEAVRGRTCSSCGHENPDGVKFCQECGARVGTPIGNKCPDCGTDNPPGTRFCGECGFRLEG